MWADTFSRRALLAVGPLLSATGYALWTFAPSYPAFALGFILWGAQGSLRSGTLQALVYDELAAAGATRRYATVIGRAKAIGTSSVLGANALAAPVFAVGGYPAVGVASVLACVLMAAVGWSFPARVPAAHERGGDYGPMGWRAYLATLRSGAAEVRRRPAVRRAVLLTAALAGFDALDEYLPLLARSVVANTAGVPLLVTVVAVGSVLGSWFAGRAADWSSRRLGAAVVLAAVALAGGAGSGHAAGFGLLAVAFAVFQITAVVTDARLQDAITGPARATVTSLAGFGVEVSAVLIYATYAAGSSISGHDVMMAAYGIPLLVIGLLLTLPRRHFQRAFQPGARVRRARGRNIQRRRPRQAAEEVDDVSAVRNR